MEADWEVEIGPDAPVIDASWPGFVDLRRTPELARRLPEAVSLPGLADALQRLNSQHSPVWTSKCDVWPVLEPLDADEMGTSDECTAHAWACYIDLLPRSDQQWGDQQWIVPEMVVSWCRVLTEQLRGVPLSCCRVDFIVRRAVIGPGSADIGITAYLTACGANVDAAKERLQEALGQFVEVFFVHSTVK